MTSWPSQVDLQNTVTASLQRGKTPTTSVQSDGEASVMLELKGNVEYPFITIAPKVLSMCQLELFDI